MQYSIGVEYALHCLLNMIDIPLQKSVGIKDLAAYQGISSTYLSKIYAKLKKAGIVKSIPGVNGGYELAKHPDEITFWDIIESIEGSSPIFQCVEIRQKEILVDKDNLPDLYTKCPCLINVVMTEAEEQMREYLRNKTLGWLHKEVNKKVPPEARKATIDWFKNSKLRKNNKL